MNATRFEDLVAQHRLSVLRICRSVLRDDHLSTDAVQEVFLRLWGQIRAGEGPEQIGAWVRQVATRVAIDFQRRRQARPEKESGSDLRVEPSRIQGPLEQSAHDELMERFGRALERLSDQQRSIFLLRHEGGLKLAEIASALERSLPTIKTQFARACLKLQESLSAYQPRTEEKDQ